MQKKIQKLKKLLHKMYVVENHNNTNIKLSLVDIDEPKCNIEIFTESLNTKKLKKWKIKKGFIIWDNIQKRYSVSIQKFI